MQSLPGCPAKPHVLSLKKERRMLNSVDHVIYCTNRNGKNSEGSEIVCHLKGKFTWNSSMDTGKGMRMLDQGQRFITHGTARSMGTIRFALV